VIDHPVTRGPIAVIAEDEEIGRLLLAESAAAAGLEPVMFENGRDALLFVQTCDVALVFLDVEMPGLDGYEVCRQIRAMPRYALVPIVMVTGRDDKLAINRAFEAGATDFISKPVSWALLPHRLEYILRNATSVRALADREAKLNTLLEAIPDALWVVSPDGEPRWSPNAHMVMPQFDKRPSPSIAFEAALPSNIRSDVSTAIRKTATDGKSRKFGYRHEEADGAAHRSAELRFSRCEGGDVLIVRQDTSERTAAAESIERLAYFDTLTGLPNRQRLIETAERFLAWAEKAKERVALIYLDLNSFKRINDSFGHSVGDAVLKRVADTLSSVLSRFVSRPGDLALARLGGDEFVILLTDASAREAALDMAAACCAALEKPLVIDQLEFLTTPSIGVAIYPEDGIDVETLLKHADTAMYQAKAAGGPSVSVYTPAMSARLRDQLDLETRLRRAVRDGLLDVRYQPKFRLSDNSLAGVEVLSRWYDSELGEIAPSRFIQLAEESNLIVDIGAWLARTVCQQIRGWLDLGVAVPVAINVSGKELLFGDPARIIETEARSWNIPTSLIEIEITESVFVADSTAGRGSVEKLRGLGCRIALDDFGTGYSSLAYLTNFPPDRLKIDKSFVKNVDTSASDGAVVNAITLLAKSLGLKVTAEGVERQAQLAWLRHRGCDEAQGFLLSRPMCAADLESRYLLPARPLLDTGVGIEAGILTADRILAARQ
jgi:diguanylate cyclase